MISFFLLSLPIFAVIGVGWAATRTRLVAQGALDALNAFSFRFALPALLLRLIAGQPLRQSFNPEFYTGYLASGAIIFVLVLGTSRVVAARDLSTAGVHATTATVSNLGFLGPPLMLAFFGERGAGPLAMAILAEVMVLLSVGSVLMGANGGPKRGIGSLILRSRPARNPSFHFRGNNSSPFSLIGPHELENGLLGGERELKFQQNAMIEQACCLKNL